MVFFAEISSLGFPKNVVYTKYLKLLTINYFNRVFACNFFTMFKFNKTYMKYTQFLKLLLATIAKSSSVAKF